MISKKNIIAISENLIATLHEKQARYVPILAANVYSVRRTNCNNAGF